MALPGSPAPAAPGPELSGLPLAGVPNPPSKVSREALCPPFAFPLLLLERKGRCHRLQNQPQGAGSTPEGAGLGGCMGPGWGLVHVDLCTNR